MMKSCICLDHLTKRQVAVLKKIRILGIDPGYAIVGFGVLDYDGVNFSPIEYGAQARGITVLSAAIRNVPVSEYTPLQVKLSVTGYGKAEKKQVMEMTKSILGLAQIPKPDDAADALAIAVCHGHTVRWQ